MEHIHAIPIAGFREPFCALSHFAGAIVFAWSAVAFVVRAKQRHSHVVSLAVMGVTAVLLLSLSGTYHTLWPGTAREVMRRLDVAGIFLLIAGTITPVHMMLFQGMAKWLPLLLVWGLSITGLVLRMVFFDSLPPLMGTAAFLILGWGGAISTYFLWRRHDWSFVSPLVYGGIAYTIGAIILGSHWPMLIPGYLGPHELWHIAVLVGLSLHWHFASIVAFGYQSIEKQSA